MDFDDAMAEHGLGIAGTSMNVRLRGVAGEATVLGRFVDGMMHPIGTVEPFGEQPVRAASVDEAAAVWAALDGTAATIDVGRLRDFPELPARLRSSGFSRHTFMCGQSGSGKTYTTGVLFERLLIGSRCRSSCSIRTPTTCISTPSPTPATVDPKRSATERSRRRRRGHRARAGYGGSSTLCIDFSDLDLAIRAKLLHLDPIVDLDDFNALCRITEGLGEAYSVHDVASAAAAEPATAPLAVRIENLGIADWGLWRRNGETSVATSGLRNGAASSSDTGSLATPTERVLIAAAVLGNRWQARRERHPILLAIDEAHNVLPAVTNDPLLQSAVDLGTLIAGEGRKFGIHLFIASQRPGKVHPNVLSQCDNLVLMRMNGAHDVADLESAFSHVPPLLLHEALSFGLGQALFAGPLSPLPQIAQVGTRLTPEGGADVPTTWTAPPSTG